VSAIVRADGSDLIEAKSLDGLPEHFLFLYGDIVWL
jgi:hypothetical protein